MFSIVLSLFTGKSLLKAINGLSISWSLGPIIGPFIGGYLQHYFNWQADFYFFGIAGLTVFLLIFFTLPETHFNLQPLHPKKIFTNIKTVISHKIFLLVTIVSALIYTLMVVFNMIGPFIVQKVLNFSAVQYGHMALVLGAAYFLGSTTNRILINYIKPLHLALASTIISLIITGVMLGCSVSMPINIYIVLIPVSIIFFLGGLVIPNMAGKSSTIFPTHLGGTVSALFGSVGLLVLFVISLFATLLKTNTSVPISGLYVSLILIVLILLGAIFKLEKNK